jgi:hypothetical protein
LGKNNAGGMKELILVLAKKDKDALGAVRCHSNARAATDGNFIWVRGFPITENIDLKIKQLPAIHTYFLGEDDLLFPNDAKTPVGKLKRFPWVSLQSFITIEIPVAAYPGRLQTKHSIRLVPSENAHEGNALLTNLAEWKKYAETAPSSRLKRLKFAVSDENKVVILGTPIAPIPGKELWIRDGILLPCGFDFEIPLMSTFVSKKLNPENDCVLVFEKDNDWEKIPLSYFIGGKRSAVRLTKGGNKNG